MRWRAATRRPSIPFIAAVLALAPACRERRSEERAPEKRAPEVQAPPPLSKSARSEAVRGLEPPPKRDDRFRRGIALGLFASAEDKGEAEAIERALLGEVKAIGATDVELTIEWSMKGSASTEISPPKDRIARDARLESAIAFARERGMRVFLMPIVRLEQRSLSDWRGTIRPKDEAVWWGSYRTFVLHYADLAARRSVELFSVGSELMSMEAKTEAWKSLIAEVRKRYSGELTYSANWDQLEVVEFWSSLDVIGVSAYPPLVPDASTLPEAALLDEGWKPFLGDVARLLDRTNGRLVLTEVGYPSHTEGALRPWDERPRGEPDPKLQLACYRALYKAFAREPRLEGVFVWNWFGPGGPSDRGYTPRGKPASEVLRLWFSGSKELVEEH
jgi:glycosyl hydrolase family 113